MTKGEMFPELVDQGIPVEPDPAFMWAMAQREYGMTHWLGRDWQNGPMVIHRLLVGEINELYQVLKVNKFGQPDTIDEGQRHQLRLKSVDCFILTLTQFMKHCYLCHSIFTPRIMASQLVSWWDRAVLTDQQQVTGREATLAAIDHFTEFALGHSGDRPLEGRMEPVMIAQFRLFIALGVTLDQAIITLAGKQVLNEFRTNQNYNAGGYRKNWWWNPGKGADYPTPDSLIADQLIGRVDFRQQGFKNQLYNQFIEIYDKG